MEEDTQTIKINYIFLSFGLLVFLITSHSIALFHTPTYSKIDNPFTGTSYVQQYSQEGIILTCYFTTLPDPQTFNYTIQENNFEYIRPLYESSLAHNIPLVIFHDSLDDNFKRNHSNPLVTFVQVHLRKSISINDERFIFYKEYINNNNLASKYKYILLSDISDVIIYKNPFIEFNYFAKTSAGGCKLWLIREDVTVAQRRNLFNRCYDVKSNFLNKNFELDSVLYNAGVIGGYSNEISILLDNLIGELLRINEGNDNCNMPALQYVIQHYYDASSICSEGLCWKEKCDQHRFIHHKPPLQG